MKALKILFSDIKMVLLWQNWFWITFHQIVIITVNSSALPKSNVSFQKDLQLHRCWPLILKKCEFTRNISVLFNLILAKHKSNPNFNGHRNVDRLVQNTVRRYMLDLTGFLSEAGKFFVIYESCVENRNLRTVRILLVCCAASGSLPNTCR